MKSDTIAAIATAMSPSGIGIIRISGEDSLKIIDSIYRSKSGKKRLSEVDSHTVHYGFIFDYFKEMDAYPGESLYDAFYYPTMGILLKEHPQIDFSDVSHYKIEESKSKIHCYLFETSEHKIYGYSADGKGMHTFKDKEDNDIFEIKMIHALI